MFVAVVIICLSSPLWVQFYNLPIQEKPPSIVLTPTATPTPEPTTSVITFTALYCTLSTGNYQVITTDGRILNFADYETYDTVIPQGTYVGEVRNGVVVSSHILGYASYQEPYVVGRYQNYPQYYYYQDQYWQYDGRHSDRISWKSAQGERIIYGRPPDCEDAVQPRITMEGYEGGWIK